MNVLPWELQEAEEALTVKIEQIAGRAGASSPVLHAEDFPSFNANFESLRQLSFNGVKLNPPLKSEADGEDSERYSLDEYLGTAWGAGDAVIKDEVADFCKALAHFLDSRYRKNKGAPQQGGAAAGHQTLDLAGVAASKLVTSMGKVFDLRKLVVPLDSASESAADAALATIHAHALESGTKLAALDVLAPQLVELRRRLVAAAASAPYSARDVVEEQRGGTKVEVDQGGWFKADGSPKSGTVIMVALFKLDALSGAIPELSKGLGQIVYLLQHCALKSKNEACVEGYGSIIERHASKLRGTRIRRTMRARGSFTSTARSFTMQMTSLSGR